MNDNRKTTIPLKAIPEIVEWLLKNCSEEELTFMIELASDRRKFFLLNAIFTRLTDCNVHEVFYGRVNSPEELYGLWTAKRGEVAGLKAFSMACQAAMKQKEDKRIKKKEKNEPE